MNIAQIETNLQELIADFNRESFIYDLLLAYGLPKASITRLRRGNLNLSKIDGDISWKRKLYFREEQSEDLHLTISDIAKKLKQDERFVVITNYTTLLAIDTKTDDRLDIDLQDLPKHYDFFLPWAGMEKAQHAAENPADVRAAVRMAQLFDRIKADNPDESPQFLHGLNVFLSRLLFCYFAEDTHIFEENQFTNAIASHTQQDGSDLSVYLDKLFEVLNTHENQRENLPEYLNAFPYVNGGLFRDKLLSPKFTRRSRASLLHGGDQNWSAINPDIFGSMFQASVSLDQRGHLGQHYTSVPNIMKVIEPLFLNELYEELEKAGNDTKKLNALLTRIHNIKIFDPACGSGNFLIIAYKELRILEMKIFKAGNMMALSGVQLLQFYGIEIDDFAGEIAKLALWLAEHQMNVEFRKEFGRTNPTLPLTEAGKIVIGNACRLDWEEVCPKNEGDEIYILGNPPYLGGKLLSKEQKEETKIVFKEFKKYNNIDYIGCWFYKGVQYINEKVKVGFVTTNSINQGTQVNDLWPNLLNEKVEISYAEKDFIWSNNAKDKAGVTCSIIILSHKSNKQKYILHNEIKKKVNNINAYLFDSPNIYIEKRTLPLSNLPEMKQGNIPLENGFLRMSKNDKDNIVRLYPESEVLFRKVTGSAELINNIERWCLWISDEDLELAKSIPEINKRINSVYEFRKEGAQNAIASKNRPHQFVMINTARTTQVVIPIVSSEKREIIPISFINADIIVMNSALVIYDPEPYMFGVLNSKIHLIWIKAFSGKLESRFRYSVGLCWYSFPFPPISTQRKNEITQAVFRILEEREKHSDKTLAQLYDPDKMPEGLREAHRQNDLIVEKCYRSRPFESDEERLEYLFKLYEQMIEEEKQKDTLFEKEKKKKR
ncbi:MAG: N-6 DNA methylase [Dysgonamonadaceae bacterium]|nr:N-6 DNA methylase [Dysgonamonadaceae bacterium]